MVSFRVTRRGNFNIGLVKGCIMAPPLFVSSKFSYVWLCFTIEPLDGYSEDHGIRFERFWVCFGRFTALTWVPFHEQIAARSNCKISHHISDHIWSYAPVWPFPLVKVPQVKVLIGQLWKHQGVHFEYPHPPPQGHTYIG